MGEQQAEVRGPDRPAEQVGGDPRRPDLLAVANGDPRSPGTFSGVTASLLHRLEESARIQTMDVRPGLATNLAAAATTFRPNPRSWRARYRVGKPFTRSMARRAEQLAAELPSIPDVVLQFGSWFDLSGIDRFNSSIRCTYIDTNFASYLRRCDVDVGPQTELSRWRLDFEKNVYDRLDLIFTFSEWARSSMIDDFDQPADKVIAVGTGANVSADAVERRPEAIPRYLFVGKKFVRKGGPELLAAFARVRAEVPEAELWVVGPDKQPFADQAGVVFWGRLDPSTPGDTELLRILYERASAFVMPSRFEPFGIVFAEAMMTGLPCVATDCCAMPEIVEDGITGHIVPPGDVDALADAMLAMARDPEQALAMGRAGRTRAVSGFSWEAVAERVLSQIATLS